METERFSTRSKWQRIPLEKKRKCYELYMKGHSLRKIAMELGIKHPDLVRRAINFIGGVMYQKMAGK